MDGRTDGALTLLTPFDPLFLLLSFLVELGEERFWDYNDLWEKIAETMPAVEGEGEEDGGRRESDVLAFGALSCVTRRMGDVCEVKGSSASPFPSVHIGLRAN